MSRNPPPRDAARAVRPGALEAAVAELASLAAGATLPALLPELRAGRTAVWGGGSWEAPLLYACGAWPLPINELWREGSREAADLGESEFQVPAEYCSMIKAVVGRLRLLRDSPVKKLVHFGGACEPISIALERVRQDGYDLFCIEGVTSFQPQPRRDRAMVAAVASELGRLARWLTGAPPDEVRVLEEIRRKNRIARRVRRVLELRLRDPSALGARAVLQLLAGSSHYFCRPERFEGVVARIEAELERVPEAASPGATGPTPLVFAGGAAAGLEVFDLVERAGAAVLGWVTFHSVDRLVREDLPPLEAIARYLVEAQQAGELGELGGAPVLPRRDRLEDELRRTGARGIIAAGVTGCPYNTILQQVEREHFKRRGIPIVALETSVHREPPTEEQLMKLRTFLEIVQAGAGAPAAARR